MTEIRQWIDHGEQDGTFSVATQKMFIEDGREYPIGEQIRRVVTPLDIENIDDLTEEIQAILKAVWTKEVINKFKAKIEIEEGAEDEEC